MGLYGKTWPVGLAPGMGINAFVSYGICLGMGYTPSEALGAVLVAGVVFFIVSVTPLRKWLINAIPKSLKLGIGAGIGLFLAIIGFEIMGLTADHPVTLVTLGDLSNPLLLLGAAAFVTMIVLREAWHSRKYHNCNSFLEHRSLDIWPWKNSTEFFRLPQAWSIFSISHCQLH